MIQLDMFSTATSDSLDKAETEVHYEYVVDQGRCDQIITEILVNEKLQAIDTETYGIDKHKNAGLDPVHSKVRLIQIGTPSMIYLFDMMHIQDFSKYRSISESNKYMKIFHNAKFDVKMLQYHYELYFNMIFDTMLTEQLLTSGLQKSGFGLATLKKKYLGGPELDKTLQKTNWGIPVLGEKHFKYAAMDVQVLFPIYEIMKGFLKQDKMFTVARIEFDCALATAKMELDGLYLSREHWDAIYFRNKERIEVLEAEISKTLSVSSRQLTFLEDGTDVNIKSNDQLKQAFARMGFNLKDTSEATLTANIENHPIFASIIEWRGLAKEMSTYGQAFYEYVDPITNRVHSSFMQLGADTGRYSSRSPNLQNIPAKEEYRASFRPETGNKFVTADYSQIELRVLAELSQDKAFLSAFNSGADLHKATASTMFNVPISDVTKDMRSATKSINFGLAYGRGAKSLGEQIGKSEEEAEELVQKYFKTYSGIAKFLEYRGKFAMENFFSLTAANRVRYYSKPALPPPKPPYDKTLSEKERKANFKEWNSLVWDHKKAMSAIERQGKNAPIQGTSGDITKIALALVEQRIRRTPIKLVNVVHDEIILECPEYMAADVGVMLEDCMKQGAYRFIKSVPVEVDAVIADYWKKD